MTPELQEAQARLAEHGLQASISELVLLGARALLHASEDERRQGDRRRQLRERLAERMRPVRPSTPTQRQQAEKRLDPRLSELTLLDTSAWARLVDGRRSGLPAADIEAQIERGQVAPTEPLLLEMRYSARAAPAGVSHRVKPIDLLVAAVAERYQAAVVHYDRDYEWLAERTDLDFDRLWATPRGSIS